MGTATMGITNLTTGTIITTDIKDIIRDNMMTADEAMGTIIADQMMNVD